MSILGKVGDSLKYIYKDKEKEAQTIQVGQRYPFSVNREKQKTDHTFH